MSENQGFTGASKEFNLSILEQRVTQLVDLVKKLKVENAQIVAENTRLKDQVEALQNSIMSETKDLEKMSKEKAQAYATVDDLIKSIDSLVDVTEGNNE